MDSANPVHMDVGAEATIVSVSSDQCRVVLALTLPAVAVQYYGAPAVLQASPCPHNFFDTCKCVTCVCGCWCVSHGHFALIAGHIRSVTQSNLQQLINQSLQHAVVDE